MSETTKFDIKVIIIALTTICIYVVMLMHPSIMTSLIMVASPVVVLATTLKMMSLLHAA